LGDQEIDGVPACAPECAGTIPQPKGPGVSFCDTHVGIYRKGELDITYAPFKKSNIILIHVEDHATIFLSTEEVKELRSRGIEKAAISRKRDKAWKVVDGPVPIEDLAPKKKAPAKVAKVATKAADGENNLKSSKSDMSSKSSGTSNKSTTTSGKSSNTSSKSKNCDDEDESSFSGWIIFAFFIFIIFIVLIVGYCWMRSYRDCDRSESYKSSSKASVTEVYEM
jgi:hypothetical protein